MSGYDVVRLVGELARPPPLALFELPTTSRCTSTEEAVARPLCVSCPRIFERDIDIGRIELRLPVSPFPVYPVRCTEPRAGAVPLPFTRSCRQNMPVAVDAPSLHVTLRFIIF